MIQPILQYRPLDRGFFIGLSEPADAAEWHRQLRSLPGDIIGRDRLTPAQAQMYLADGSLVEIHGLPLRWQRSYIWLSSLAKYTGPTSDALKFWAAAMRLLQSLLIRGAVLPRLDTSGHPWRARWTPSFTSPQDRQLLRELEEAMPPVCYAFPAQDQYSFTKGTALGNFDSYVLEEEAQTLHTPQEILQSFFEDGVDFLLRYVAGGIRPTDDPRLAHLHRLRGHKRDRLSWDERLMVALSHPMNEFPNIGITERTLGDQLAQWSEGARPQHLRPSFHLESPPVPKGQPTIQEADRLTEGGWVLRVGLETDQGIGISVEELWQVSLDPLVMQARQLLLRGIARAVPFFKPLNKVLAGQKPEDLTLLPSEAWEFITHGVGAMKEAGLIVHIPEDMAEFGGARRLRAKVKLGARTLGGDQPTIQAGIEGNVSADWSLMLGDDALSMEDFAEMTSLKHPLVAWKGKWVAIDPETMKQIMAVITASRGQGFESMTRGEAIAAALTGTTRIPGVSETIEVEVAGDFGDALKELHTLPDKPITQPSKFKGELRPYQLRGLAWLDGLDRLGLGGILADDMGLGKTIQVLALLLHRQNKNPQENTPVLLVCPTSLLGNWEREVKKFAPSIPVFVHHGNNRQELPTKFKAHTLVITTYGVVRREEEEFGTRLWSIVVIDEAQAIKNPTSAQAKAIRNLRGRFKLALTGTPIENRLTELWSIMTSVLPGYLSSEGNFKDRFSTPIEKYRDPGAAEELRQRIGPFILRRLKTDRNIIQDLPEKNEMKVFTSLSKEQALLYQARVEQMEYDLEHSTGIERRGKILALLTHLKQICNHPAHFLKSGGPYQGRSGKLDRLTEMVAEVLESDDKAIIFTQYREMGIRLQEHFKTTLNIEPPFLHGGTTREQRDEMVRAFQEDALGDRVMILSLKAGGVGLNLTAATHVFHFDRWWNPAVEDQATDRTYRIGQTKNVQVHKLVTIGTLEEKVDTILESKRDLADRVVGSGEGWLTELDNDALRRLVALDTDVESMDQEPNVLSVDEAKRLIASAPVSDGDDE